MLIKGEIQQFEEIPPTKPGDTMLYRAVIVDKSEPSAVRCTTPLEMFIGEKKREKLPAGDLTDLRVTVLVTGMKQGRVGIQCQGELTVTALNGKSAAPAQAQAKTETK